MCVSNLPPEASLKALDFNRPVARLAKGNSLGICHLSNKCSAFPHGGMVSHMQVLATLSSTVHNTIITWILTTKTTLVLSAGS